jgi:hypothetical protein
MIFPDLSSFPHFERDPRGPSESDCSDIAALRKIALQVHRLRLLDMGSLTPEHAETGVPVEIVIVVLPSVVNQEVFFFGNELQDVAGAVFKGWGQLYRQSRTRLLAKPSVDATGEIDPEPRGIATAILTLGHFHGNTTHRADP